MHGTPKLPCLRTSSIFLDALPTDLITIAWCRSANEQWHGAVISYLRVIIVDVRPALVDVRESDLSACYSQRAHVVAESIHDRVGCWKRARRTRCTVCLSGHQYQRGQQHREEPDESWRGVSFGRHTVEVIATNSPRKRSQPSRCEACERRKFSSLVRIEICVAGSLGWRAALRTGRSTPAARRYPSSPPTDNAWWR